MSLYKRTMKLALLILFLIIVSGTWNFATAETIHVSNASQLSSALAEANDKGGNTTILLQDGIYTISDMLYIAGSYITVGSQSGIRDNVIIQGDKMGSDASVTHIFLVSGSNFEVRDMTLQMSRYHIIQIQGENNADYPTIRNCILRDSYEQIVKVSVDLNNLNVSADNGLVENCLFEYSAGVGPQFYIGGIDAHGADNWVVRNNTFKSIISPSGSVAEFAIHFWSGSENNLVERNLIINCDRGIGFGLTANSGNIGGIIRNNMIYHAASTGQFADVGIALANSHGTEVYNNTVFMEHGFPWAIEYRFPGTQNVLIANNLTNKPIMMRDGASATVADNFTNADVSWFLDASSGNLHLAYAVSSIVDRGRAISGLTIDFDGQSRPQGGGIDIGADEIISQNDPPKPPTNLRIIKQ